MPVFEGSGPSISFVGPTNGNCRSKWSKLRCSSSRIRPFASSRIASEEAVSWLAADAPGQIELAREIDRQQGVRSADIQEREPAARRLEQRRDIPLRGFADVDDRQGKMRRFE